MRQENRVALTHLANVLEALDEIPVKVLLIVHDAVKDYALTEQRSVKRMESFKDEPGTAQNYRNGERCLRELNKCLVMLEDENLERAVMHMRRAAEAKK